MSHSCLVCAYPKLKEPPHSPSGGGSYEICPACGYQYGVDDDDKGITPEQWLVSWVRNGAKWSSAGIKQPKGWKYQPAEITGKGTVKKGTGKSVTFKRKMRKPK